MDRKYKLHIFAFASLLIAGLLLPAPSVFSQSSKGAIAGNVVDTTGAVVLGALVTATNVQTGALREATTDADGNYRFDALDLGTYKITIRSTGFKQTELADIPVRAAQITTADGKLEPGQVTETVEVTETAGVELQKQDGSRSSNISPREITELPIAGLNPIALALTLPGVSAPSSREDFTNGVGFSVNGTRPRGNNFLLDGQDNNDASIAGQAFQPINRDAIQEVSVLQGDNSAEYGRAGASVTNVITRGGTNDYHGTASWLVQSQILDALSAEEQTAGVTEKSVYTEQTFGFSLGGPIMKNKLLFFVSPLWDRFRSSANGDRLTIPTQKGVDTLRALMPSLSPGGQTNANLLLSSIQDLRGVANPFNLSIGGGRTPVEFGLVTRLGIAQRADSTQWASRVDWMPSGQDVVTFRYYFSDTILTPDNFANAIGLPGLDTEQEGRSQNMGINYVRTISSNVVNEFRFSYGRINFAFDPIFPESLRSPLISYNGGGALTFGLDPTWPQSRLANNFQYQDTLRLIRGNHTISLGTDLTRQLVRTTTLLDDRGSINYLGGGGFTGLGNFIDDFSGPNATVARDFGERIIYPQTFFQNYFGTDTYRLKPNLTMVYGVRYEFYGTPENILPYPASTGNPFEDFPARYPQRSDSNNLAPRFSFAYTPKIWSRIFGDEKTVIRGGYGVGYEPFFYNILVNTGSSSPNILSKTTFVNRANFPTLGPRGIQNPRQFLATAPPTAPDPAAGITSVDQNLRNPIIHNWNFGIQRELGSNIVVDVAYVGTRGNKLFINEQTNIAFNGIRMNPDRGIWFMRTNGGDSYYHSLQTKVERRFANSPAGSIFLRGAYTWSRYVDVNSEVFITSGESNYSQDILNRRADRGLSAFHRKHRFVLSYVWEIPGPPTSGNFAANALGYAFRDWQVSGISTWQSGAPYTVINAAIDANLDLTAFNDRPNLSNPNAPLQSWVFDAASTGGTPGLFYDGLAFVTTGELVPRDPSTVRFVVHGIGTPNGNLGRNTEIGGGFQRWDVTVIRRLRMPKWESHHLEFRWEAFNVFNHVNTGIPSDDLSNPNFGNFDLTRQGGRSMRFQLKYVF
ncbi:MAG: TonB-dependent receptor [Acidobacteria bacterium]|nr:TonB-dependent receptor [Acidobacteriota bacterium]